MDFGVMLKTYSGIEEYRLPYEKIGLLKNDRIKHFGKKIEN